MREPTDDQLLLVARHGTGKVERTVAIVELAKRRGREDELQQLGAVADDETAGGGND